MIKYGDYKQKRARGPVVQTQPIPGKDQIRNDAGGYVFQMDDMNRLRRFLILGCDGGTYYVNQKDHAERNIDFLESLIDKKGIEVLKETVKISDEGRAPKNDPAILVWALCMASKDINTRRAAVDALPKIARIGTHLFHAADYMESHRGWGRLAKKAFANWYLNMDINKLEYQILKYRQRDGWSHKDILRLCHPKTDDRGKNYIFKYIVKEKYDMYGKYNSCYKIAAFEKLKSLATRQDKPVGYSIRNIKDQNLTREMIPTELLNRAEVWGALLPKMPITAMIRNLGKMASIGILEPFSDNTQLVCDRLRDVERLKKGRVHPIQILSASMVYQQGRGIKGDLRWHTNSQTIEALQDSFLLAFKVAAPANKRYMLGVDVSGSMLHGEIAGVPMLTPNVAAAVMAMVTVRNEPYCEAIGFGHQLINLNINKTMSLCEVIVEVSDKPFGGTNASLPIKYALDRKIPVDCFVTYTDNETWHGNTHPCQVLESYRQKMGIDAKLVICAFTATHSTIGDSDDKNTLDVVGFDTNTPSVISEFAKGGF